jgi:hypothetical protein
MEMTLPVDMGNVFDELMAEYRTKKGPDLKPGEFTKAMWAKHHGILPSLAYHQLTELVKAKKATVRKVGNTNYYRKADNV